MKGGNTGTLARGHRTRNVNHDDRQRATKDRGTTRERGHQHQFSADNERLVIGDEVTNTQNRTGNRQAEHSQEVHKASRGLKAHNHQPCDDHAQDAGDGRCDQGQDGRVDDGIISNAREHVLEVLQSEGVIHAQDRDEGSNNNRCVDSNNESGQQEGCDSQRDARLHGANHTDLAGRLARHGNR